MDDEWEPWRTDGTPSVGDYVQVKIACHDCDETELREGFVSAIDPAVTLLPAPVTYLCFPNIVKWRRKKPPSVEDEIINEKELENA